jgi:hypothetical protein
MRKSYKQSILHDVISKETSKLLCKCNLDINGEHPNSLNRFPITSSKQHSKGCGLLKLREQLIDARRKHIDPRHVNSSSERTTLAKTEKDTTEHHQTPSLTSPAVDIAEDEIECLADPGGLSFENGHVEPQRRPSFGNQKLIKRFPFGNVHASLMVGPLMIENGANM